MEETREQREISRGRSNHQGGGLVSLRSSLWRYLGLLVVAALAVGVFAGPASAKKLTSKQRAAVRAQLKKQIKHTPKLINKKSFVKRAALVNFKLPVTIRLRGSNANTNPNQATVDLGASLGQREVDLGGALAAEITFRDSFDGGALGNVDLDILPSATKNLTSTSIPLLWNTQVTQAGTRFDTNSLQDALGAAPGPLGAFVNGLTSGCSNFTGNAALRYGVNVLPLVPGPPTALGLPGYPFWDPAGPGGLVTEGGYLPIKPGIDSITNVVASRVPGNDYNVGGNPNPFPYSAQSNPGS